MSGTEPARRTAGTREIILEAAERLFAERGFAATSVRDIVGEAQTSAPSLYHSFGSKEKLLVELIDDRHTAYCDDLEADLVLANTPFEVCQRFVKFVLTNMTKRPTTAKFLLGITSSFPFHCVIVVARIRMRLTFPLTALTVTTSPTRIGRSASKIRPETKLAKISCRPKASPNVSAAASH